jgi:hypothetical protein
MVWLCPCLPNSKEPQHPKPYTPLSHRPNATTTHPSYMHTRIDTRGCKSLSDMCWDTVKGMRAQGVRMRANNRGCEQETACRDERGTNVNERPSVRMHITGCRCRAFIPNSGPEITLAFSCMGLSASYLGPSWTSTSKKLNCHISTTLSKFCYFHSLKNLVL